MNNNISIAFDKEKCCGCSACMAICGRNAISMEYDDQGFLYPVVNMDNCVDCGQCVKVCPENDLMQIRLDVCYAAKRKDREKLLSSTSGGFAAALSEMIVSQRGVVYGVSYDTFPHVATLRKDTADGLEQLKGSKYVQTDPQNSFREVADDLKKGLTVCYTSTSCHVNGLLNYLKLRKIDTNNLLTIDLVCHGVPSPRLFEEYISWLSAKRKIINYQFRTKAKGWGGGSISFHPSISYKTKRTCNTSKDWGYIKLFFSNCCLRPHCYHCPYAGKGRAADFTIADYWDVEKVFPDFFTPNGVSLVFVNTEHGKRMIAELGDELELRQSKFGMGMDRQANLKHPSSKSPDYDQFWKDYQEGGISLVAKKYGGVTWQNQVKKDIKSILQRLGVLK